MTYIITFFDVSYESNLTILSRVIVAKSKRSLQRSDRQTMVYLFLGKKYTGLYFNYKKSWSKC